MVGAKGEHSFQLVDSISHPLSVWAIRWLMLQGWVYAERGRAALGFVVVCAVVGGAGCKVYKQGLLEQDTSLGGKTAGAGGAGGSGGASASPAMGGSGGAAGASYVRPQECAAGDCWWSGGSEECRTAGVPLPSDRPIGEDDASLPEIYLGFTQIRLGTKTPEGEPTDSAWGKFGFDLDGLCTRSNTCPGGDQVSCRSAGPAIPYDGDLCRDNTLARLLPTVTAGFDASDKYGLNEDTFNCQLWRGGYNMLVRVSNYNGEPNDGRVRVDYYLSTGIEETIPWNCPTPNFRAYPRWRSLRTWGVDDRSLTGPISTPGTLPDSKFADVDAYVREGYLVARVPEGTEQGFIGDGNPYRGWLFKPRRGVFVGRLGKEQDGTWKIGDGLLGGRIAKQELVRSFHEAGFCDAGAVNTFYSIMIDALNETADVLASGETDATEPCDAVSYGFAFEAGQLLPGKAVKVPPRVECCEPGKSIDECMEMCGDGRVSGKEKCDTKIPAGEPGACPTTCESDDGCVPRSLSGSECSTECVPMPITMIGARDECCPDGANVTTDPDCKAECGNGVVEVGETCDPDSSCVPCEPTPCFTFNVTGGPATCDQRCEYNAVTNCLNGDRCCPEGCTNGTDNDCSSTCNNGVLEAGETCEAGTSRPCPESCADNDPCTIDRRAGAANTCSVRCSRTRITEAIDGDRCCPDGATSNTDNDCEIRCGNRVLEAGEQCDDGNDNAGDGCVACRKEDDQDVCIMKLGGDNECNRCTCTSCPRQGLRCFDHPNDDLASDCRDLVLCSWENNCGQPSCYCGEISLFSCVAGGAVGKCKSEVEAAAGTQSIFEIEPRSRDPNYALGTANELFTCIQRYCDAECNGPDR